ncbi:MAG: helix-turn-helix domain-containing protein [Alphaproteobacteria bacterium]
MHNQEPLLTVVDMAGEFQVSPRTVRRWIADGDLPVVRIGGLVRIRPRDRDAFIREHLS